MPRPVSRRPALLLTLIALALGLLVGGGVAGAATPNDTTCRKLLSSTSSPSHKDLLTYAACRDDLQDAALKRIEDRLAAGSTPTSSATAVSSPTATSSPTSSPTATATATSSPTPTAPAAGSCAYGKEVVRFTREGSADLDQYGQGHYNASTELWNTSGYSYAQTMGVCTHDAWYADVTTDNAKGDGAVKAYPSMRKIYHDWSTRDFSADPLVSSFPRLDVTFGANDPPECVSCIYDTAFDVWLNGIGGNANELMIWTHNVGQRPSGSKVASGIQVSGHTWDLWSTGSRYLAYVPTDVSNLSAATISVKDFATDAASRGQLPSASRLGQVSYGVETVSTGGVSRHWDFTRFTVVDS